MRLQCGRFLLDLDRPVVMGIINVTPDSFSDGGQFLELPAALARAQELVAEGAAIVDVGGESTRPGAQPVDDEEELRRVIPLIERLAGSLAVPVSIDTRKPAVMRRAIAAGASLVNDVSALAAPGALAAVAESSAAACLMHMQGEPRTMQDAPHYDDVVGEVRAFLRERAAACERAGIPRSRLVVDPGFGFGKSLEHNLALLRGLPRARIRRTAGARRPLAQAHDHCAHGPRRRRPPRRKPGSGGHRVHERRAHHPGPRRA